MDKRKAAQIQIEIKLITLCEQGQYEQFESFFDTNTVSDKNILDSCFLATCRAYNYLGDYENILMLLINKGLNVNVREKVSDKTGLILAVQNNNLGLIKTLLENKADPNLVDKEGKSPLWYASSLESGENIDIVDMLLDYKANPETKAKDGTTPLLIALKRSFEKISVSLIKRISDFSFKEKSTGNSYLHVAAYRNIESAVKHLLKKGMVNADNLNNDCKLASDLTISDKILDLLNNSAKKIEDQKKDKTKPKNQTTVKRPMKKKNSEKIELTKVETNKPKQRVSLKSHKELEKNVKNPATAIKETKKMSTNSVSKQKEKQDIQGKYGKKIVKSS